MAGSVYITKYKGQADWKVYFTDYEGEERNTELLRGCTLTEYKNSASVKVYITDYERGHHCYHAEEFPSVAGIASESFCGVILAC